MKKYLITGLAVLLPFALTLMIAIWLVNILTAPFIGIMERMLISYEQSHGLALIHHQSLVIFISKLLVLCLLVLCTFLLGYLARPVFRATVSKKINSLFDHIPFFNSIYRITKEIAKALFSEEGKTFKQTVLVPFPKENTHAIGLVTGEVPLVLKEKIKHIDLAVFIPTSPHPISGFILMTPKEQALPIDLTTEEVFKFLLSCGLVDLPNRPKEQSDE